jgi:hypothetical protein
MSLFVCLWGIIEDKDYIQKNTLSVKIIKKNVLKQCELYN